MEFPIRINDINSSNKKPGKVHRDSTGHRIITRTNAKLKRLRKQEKFPKDSHRGLQKSPH